MDIGGVVEVMQVEGQSYGADIEASMLGNRGGSAWRAVVADIYDSERMSDVVLDGMARSLSGADVAPMLEFFESDRGQRIVALELSARQALLDDEVEALATERYEGLKSEGDPRLDLLTAFIEANDLIDSNVVGGLNANYAFYQGLRDGGALDGSFGEAEILADVWSQEDAIRTDTTEWVYAYLTMAYQPLDDADIEAYTAFSETEAGRRLNRALFDAFDEIYTGISHTLGRTAATYLSGEDI